MTPAQFRANLALRFAETMAEDERVAAELKARLPEAERLICAALGPRRVTLYGSLATGLFFAAHSDVDLAVEGLGEAAPDGLRVALRALMGRRVDLVDPALVAPAVRRAIESEGLVVGGPAETR
jgi:predicted nucleotidyltransferase